MGRLIILSNRVDVPQPQKPQGAGGLMIALQQALQNIQGVWLGWNGQISDTPTFTHVNALGIDYITTDYTAEQYAHFYSGFANRILWPAFHRRRDLIEEQPNDYATYQSINQLFARKLNDIAQPDDVIWIHDYHFLSVAYYCRQLNMPNKIGFFLHIPFAKTSDWQAIRQHAQLAQHMSHYDLIGLQTEPDAVQCRQLVSRQRTKIQAYPIGIDVEYVQQIAQHTRPINQTAFKHIIAVDRIDYSKGLLQRLHDFTIFLKQNPVWQQRLQLLQVASPCRLDVPSYQQLHQQFFDQVDVLNHNLGTAHWQPVHCLDTMPYAQLMAYYRTTPIAWVNSMADGMNLVAKEYIAAQNPDDPGVLILSKYAGAALQMPAALIIDPVQHTDVQYQLKTALNMPPVERKWRYQQLISGLKHHDIKYWRNTFLDDLAACPSRSKQYLEFF